MSIAFRVADSKFWDHLLYQILQRACLWWASLSEWKLCYRPTNYHWRPRTWSLDKRSLKSNPNPAQIELKTNRLHDQIIAKDFLYRPSLIGGDNCNSFVVHYICTKGGEGNQGKGWTSILHRTGVPGDAANELYFLDIKGTAGVKVTLINFTVLQYTSTSSSQPPLLLSTFYRQIKVDSLHSSSPASHQGYHHQCNAWREQGGGEVVVAQVLWEPREGLPLTQPHRPGPTKIWVRVFYIICTTSFYVKLNLLGTTSSTLIHKWYGINFEIILWVL